MGRKKTVKKQLVTRTFYSDSTSCGSHRLGPVIAEIEAEGFDVSTIEIEFEKDYSGCWYEGDNDYYSFTITASRPETDEEIADRIAKEEKRRIAYEKQREKQKARAQKAAETRRKKREEVDYAAYLKLKKKFEVKEECLE